MQRKVLKMQSNYVGHIALYCIVILIFCSIPGSHGLYEGLYCGKENCYEVLHVTRQSSKSDIAKAYRKLAKEWHPDMHQSAEAKKVAEKEFHRIATAYEILRDEESKADYDNMLDKPDEFYWHYYTYYYRRVRPKVDVRVVVAVTITVISLIQYFAALSNYRTAIDYLITVPKYRMRALEIAKNGNLLELDKKKMRSKSKAELKEFEDSVLRSVIEEKMDIKGGYRRPHWTDVLWVQLVILPYTIAVYLKWYVIWVWRHNINKQEYNEEEKLYLIRKYVGCTATQWEAVEDTQKAEYIRMSLWKRDVFDTWKAEQEAERKAKLAESARYKSYRRYMKNNHSQMTFGPD